MIVGKLLSTIARLLWGASLVLTSVYCLLAFLPYTYFELIKSPAYEWMPWLARHQGNLSGRTGGNLFCGMATGQKSWGDFSVRTILLGYGLCLLDRPFLPSVEDNWVAYCWGLIALCPLIVSAGFAVVRRWPPEGGRTSQQSCLFERLVDREHCGGQLRRRSNWASLSRHSHREIQLGRDSTCRVESPFACPPCGHHLFHCEPDSYWGSANQASDNHNGGLS